MALTLMLSAVCALGEGEPASRYKLEELTVYYKASADILDGLNLMRVKYNNQSYYALYDFNGKALTEAKYYSILAAKYGFVSVRNDDGLYGALNSLGEEVIPCAYDDIKYYSDRWMIGIKLAPTEGEPYDYKSFFSSENKFYIVTQYDVYYKGALLKTLARDDYDLSTAYAYGDYLYLRNRAKETFFYDKEFNAVSATTSQEYQDSGADVIHVPTGQKAFCKDCPLEMDNVKYPYRYIKSKNAIVDIKGTEVLKLDRVYSNVSEIINGYMVVQDIDTRLYGIIDMKGNTIIPCEYSYIIANSLFNSQYQYVNVDDHYGYYNEDGVLTCPAIYPYKSAKEYSNKGMIYVDMNNKYKYVSPALGMLDKEFKELRFTYDTLAPVMVVTNQADEVGLMDVYGDMILPYQNISSYNIQVSIYGEAIMVKKDSNVYVYGVVMPDEAPNEDTQPADESSTEDNTPAVSDDGKWVCDCGSENTTKFCPNCGNAKPVELVTVCPNCQTEASDPQNPPKFCPECGTKMN